MCVCVKLAGFVVKVILFVVNFFISLAGLVLIGFGVALLVGLNEGQANLNQIPTTIIVIGCIVFLVSFFGCCGAIRESRCLLIMYSTCMAILTALQIYVTVVYYRFLDDYWYNLRAWFQDSLTEPNLKGTFHALEATLHCCGVTGANSYAASALPASCCAPAPPCEPDHAHPGCADPVDDSSGFVEAVGTVLIIIIIVEASAMVLGAFMAWRVKDKKSAVV